MTGLHTGTLPWERLQLQTMVSGEVIDRPSKSRLWTTLTAILLLMGQATAASVSWAPRKIAELQLQAWRDQLPGVEIPEAVRTRLSPLTETQAHNFKSIIQKPNPALALNATEFCGSSDLLCHQDVIIMKSPTFGYGVKRGYTNEEQKHMFIDAEELKEGGQITMPDLHDPIPWKSFLPLDIAKMMPFSTSALPELLELLRIPQNSNMSRNMLSALKACEGRVEEGEVRMCGTSMESMIEFVVSNVGSDVELVSHPSTAGSGKAAIIRKMTRRNYVPFTPPVACHSFVFPFGVYFCHSINGTHTIHLELEVPGNVTAANVINSTAVCHHFSKGKETVCHLIYGGTLLWLPKGLN